MIGYVTLGTNDLARSTAFFDELFGSIGIGRFIETDSFVAWAPAPDKPGVSVTKPFNGEKATVGNGVMVALSMDSPEQVDTFYEKAISLGAICEGKSGPRDEMPGFYAGYFRDLDGNKFNAFHMAMG